MMTPATKIKRCQCGAAMIAGPSGWVCEKCEGKIVPYERNERQRIPVDAQIIGPNDPEPACDTCHGTLEIECPECDGEGWYECPHCGHETNCEECGEGGVVDCRDCKPPVELLTGPDRRTPN